MEQDFGDCQVISLLPPRSCEDCVNVLYGRGGLYCREFHEDIWDPAEALVCTLFDPDD